jgi:hypothetical protein
MQLTIDFELHFCYYIVMITREYLTDKSQTAQAMYDLTERFYGDIDEIYTRNSVPLSNLPLTDYFDLVKNIPYKRDPHLSEIVARPKIGFSLSNADCKKKAIMIASYLKRHNIPYRFIGSSSARNRRIHHVFPQALISGQWVNLDATYKNAVPFDTKRVTKAVIL